ncbi:hypothetical protein AB8A21_16805 [Streptomyces sp. BF23-18]|uniref:hypothetical protein n=1 Tax=Streptomyces sp. BF23-18 TaxID=3240282 RepID=UPI0034E3BB80
MLDLDAFVTTGVSDDVPVSPERGLPKRSGGLVLREREDDGRRTRRSLQQRGC